jgi:hypothetical protein
MEGDLADLAVHAAALKLDGSWEQEVVHGADLDPLDLTTAVVGAAGASL